MDRFAHYEWPFFEPRHAQLAKQAEAFAKDNFGYAHGEDADAICRRLVQDLGCAGFLSHCVTEKPDVRSIALLREVFAYHAGLADFSFVMQGLGSGPIALAGDPFMKNRYLVKAAAGDAIAAFALSEPEAGSDVQAMTATARREGGGWVLDGDKTWISNGGIADHYVVFCRTGEAPGAKGLSAFIVEAGTPGLTIGERIETSAPHPLAALVFENCRVPLANRLGTGGDGFKIAMATLDIFRSTVGAAALGFARRALAEGLARAQARPLFGAKLADLQMTQAALAEMVADVEAAALLVYRAAWVKDQGAERVTKEAALAKLVATENAQKVVDRAVQLWGGLGVTRGVKVEELYRDVRALRIYEGASEVQKIVIARAALAEAAAGQSMMPKSA